MVAFGIAVLALLAAATSLTAVIRLLMHDGYGPVPTLVDYDTRAPSVRRS